MRPILVILLCLIAVGCQSDPRCRRETALLRAEILDLEDKYYSLKSDYESKIGPIEGEAVASEYYDGEILYEGDIYEGDVIYDGQIMGGEVIDDGVVIHDGVIHDGVIHDGVIHDGVIHHDGTIIQNGTVIHQDSSQPALVVDRSTLPLDLEVDDFTIQPDVSQVGQYDNPRSVDDNGAVLSLNSPDDLSRDHFGNDPRAFNPGPDFYISEVIIDADSTRGTDVDGVVGDEGINLMVQPRDSNGHVQNQAGELTVSVIDPVQAPERQRIGLWKFLPHETKLFFTEQNQGILLHLPWDQSTPVNRDLVLHVRFVTADGRVLKTNGNLSIRPPSSDYDANDPLVTQWTHSDPRWINNIGSQEQTPTAPAIRSKPTPTMRSATPLEADVSSPTQANARIEKPAWRPIR